MFTWVKILKRKWCKKNWIPNCLPLSSVSSETLMLIPCSKLLFLTKILQFLNITKLNSNSFKKICISVFTTHNFIVGPSEWGIGFTISFILVYFISSVVRGLLMKTYSLMFCLFLLDIDSLTPWYAQKIKIFTC